jgi:hypothetical protein
MAGCLKPRRYKRIIFPLAKNYTVIAPDMRGLGDSSKPLTGYDGKTVAEDIHQLVTKLGSRFRNTDCLLLCSCTSYGRRLVVMDMNIAGFIPA